MTDWEQVKQPEIPTWKPTMDGDEIEGVLLDKQENIGVNKAKLYVVETKPGFKLSIWGKTILDDLLEKVAVGERVKIVFKGKKGKAFRYDVYTAKKTEEAI